MKKLIQLTLACATLICVSQIAMAQEKGETRSKDARDSVKQGIQDKKAERDVSEMGREEKSKSAKPRGDSGKNDSARANKKDKKPNGVRDEANEEKNSESGEGNAYGKNKGDQSGREFGQQRAAEARSRNDERKALLEKKVVEAKEKVTESRDRIDSSRVRVEAQKNAGELSEEEAVEKQERIDKAEEVLQSLEEKLQKADELKARVEAIKEEAISSDNAEAEQSESD